MKTMSVKRGDTIESYTELFDLFEDQDKDFLESLTKDELITLDHILDYEDYRFLVINYKTVLVVVEGEVMSFHTMDKFKELTRQLILENT